MSHFGFFSPPNIIYIAKLDFNDLCNQSILLHEIIHVFQHENYNEMQEMCLKKKRPMRFKINFWLMNH